MNQDQPSKPNDPVTQTLPPNMPVLRALFPDGKSSDTSSTKRLLSATKILAAQVVELNANEGRLQEQNRRLASRVDRFESLVLDHIDEEGKPVAGLGREQKNHAEAIARLNRQMSAALIENTALSIYNRQYLPVFWEDNKRLPTEAEATEAISAIRERVQAKADHAARQQPLWEQLCMAGLKCATCVYWKKGSAIVVPGQAQEKDHCEQPAVLLICARCGRAHSAPVEPMAVKANCTGCGFALQREVTAQGMTRTCCTMHTPSNESFRAFCIENGLDPEFYDQVANFAQPATPGEPGVAVPRDPTAEPLKP